MSLIDHCTTPIVVSYPGLPMHANKIGKACCSGDVADMVVCLHPLAHIVHYIVKATTMLNVWTNGRKKCKPCLKPDLVTLPDQPGLTDFSDIR